jgi:hypothetical protein
MPRSEALVILVSRVTYREADFFSVWGLNDEPSNPPYSVYLSRAGLACSPESAELVLIQGHKRDLAARVLFVARPLRGFASASLLVHTGAGEALATTFKNQKVQHDSASDWNDLLRRSFTLLTGHCPYNFIRNELATYATEGQASFQDALTLLQKAIDHAVNLHPGGVDQAGTRSAAAAAFLKDANNRTTGGLSAEGPSRALYNPVAALIHDVVGRFDGLLMDLQTGFEDDEYWKEEAAPRYKDHVKTYVDNLDMVLCELKSPISSLMSIDQIARSIIESKKLGRDDQVKAQAAVSKLRQFAPKHSKAFAVTLLDLINQGRREKVDELDARELRSWLAALRQELSILDDLFKKSRPN